MLKYLFYRIVRFQRNILGEEMSSAAISGFLSVSLLFGLNLLTIIVFFDKKNELFDLIKSFFPNGIFLFPLLISLIIGVVCYLLFYHNKKYMKIIFEIENNPTKKRISNALAVIYQSFTFFLFFLSLLYRFS
jgi:hypothetical protein